MRQNIASVLIFRKGDKVACIKRQNTGWMDGRYALPGGKVDPGESFTHAAIREAKEEVGATVKPEDLGVVFIGHLYGENQDNIWVNVVFEVHKWTGELINAEPHMASELVWLNPNNFPENTVPQTHLYFDEIAAGHHYAERGWPA